MGQNESVAYYRTMFGETSCEIAVSPPPRPGRPFLAWALIVRDDGRLLPVVVNGRPLRGEFESAEAALQWLRATLSATFGDQVGGLTRLD